MPQSSSPGEVPFHMTPPHGPARAQAQSAATLAASAFLYAAIASRSCRPSPRFSGCTGRFTLSVHGEVDGGPIGVVPLGRSSPPIL